MPVFTVLCFVFAALTLVIAPIIPILINRSCANSKKLERECEVLQTKVKELEVKLYLKTVECEHIKATRFSSTTKTTTIYRVPEGTIDAVKLAMKVSHPDNGGKDADFIKYRNLYTQLTKGRR